MVEFMAKTAPLTEVDGEDDIEDEDE
jgi:hypothetical protein